MFNDSMALALKKIMEKKKTMGEQQGDGNLMKHSLFSHGENSSKDPSADFAPDLKDKMHQKRGLLR